MSYNMVKSFDPVPICQNTDNTETEVFKAILSSEVINIYADLSSKKGKSYDEDTIIDIIVSRINTKDTKGFFKSNQSIEDFVKAITSGTYVSDISSVNSSLTSELTSVTSSQASDSGSFSNLNNNSNSSSIETIPLSEHNLHLINISFSHLQNQSGIYEPLPNYLLDDKNESKLKTYRKENTIIFGLLSSRFSSEPWSIFQMLINNKTSPYYNDGKITRAVFNKGNIETYPEGFNPKKENAGFILDNGDIENSKIRQSIVDFFSQYKKNPTDAPHIFIGFIQSSTGGILLRVFGKHNRIDGHMGCFMINLKTRQVIHFEPKGVFISIFSFYKKIEFKACIMNLLQNIPNQDSSESEIASTLPSIRQELEAYAYVNTSDFSLSVKTPQFLGFYCQTYSLYAALLYVLNCYNSETTIDNTFFSSMSKEKAIFFQNFFFDFLSPRIGLQKLLADRYPQEFLTKIRQITEKRVQPALNVTTRQLENNRKRQLENRKTQEFETLRTIKEDLEGKISKQIGDIVLFQLQLDDLYKLYLGGEKNIKDFIENSDFSNATDQEQNMVRSNIQFLRNEVETVKESIRVLKYRTGPTFKGYEQLLDELAYTFEEYDGIMPTYLLYEKLRTFKTVSATKFKELLGGYRKNIKSRKTTKQSSRMHKTKKVQNKLSKTKKINKNNKKMNKKSKKN